MAKGPKKYLFDVLDSINLIEKYLVGFDSWKELEGDQEKMDAIHRRMGIIGEALHRLQKLEVVLANTDWAINFINSIIHQYSEIGADTLWDRIHVDLPSLKEEVEELL